VKRSLNDFRLDGGAALEFLIKSSPYGSLAQAVASLALFSHPETVAQAAGRAIFRIVRGPIPQRGEIVTISDGSRVMLDDNTGPTDAFIWANGIRRGTYSDVQFCHIWQVANDPTAYTNLANMCLLPAFLAKLSDTHPEITNLLRRRSRELFGWHPASQTGPSTPSAEVVEWAPTLPPTLRLEQALRAAMATKPRSRTTISAREIGWLFSDFAPDSSLPSPD
jgi:hypothetical protein